MKNYTLILALFIGLIPASFASAEGSYLPEVSTFAASSVTTSSATLEGSVNVWGEAGQFWFEYGKDQNNFTLQSASENTYSSASAVESKMLTDLSPNTTYYFRVVADNSFGQVKGAVKSFTTLPAKTTVAATVTPTPTTTNSGSVTPAPKSTPSASSTSTSASNANSQTASAASAVTAGSGFMPGSFGGWLLVLVLIAAIVVVVRYIYVMREKEREEQMARMSEMRTA